MMIDGVDTTPMLPNDLELERAVLGQCLRWPCLMDYRAAGLRAGDFFRTAHALVYQATERVVERGEVADLVSVGAELRAERRLDDVGAAYFGALVDSTLGTGRPVDANVKSFVARMKELSAARALVALSERAQRELGHDPGKVRDFFQQHLADIDKVRQGIATDVVLFNADDQFDQHRTYVEMDELERVPFGWDAIDTATNGGMRSGEVAAIMARPGIGKTIALCNIAHTASVCHPASGKILFSLEMPAAQMVERLKRIAYDINRHELRDATKAGTLDRSVYIDLFANLVIVDKPGLSISDMAGIIRQVEVNQFAESGVGLVMVDHFGLIGGDRGMSTYDRVSTQARELKELAKRHNLPVLIALQVNRESGGDGSKELSLGAARDSGVIEEAMDYMIGLRRPDRQTGINPADRLSVRGVMMAKLIKNRHGDLGNEVRLNLNPSSLKLSESTSAFTTHSQAPGGRTWIDGSKEGSQDEGTATDRQGRDDTWSVTGLDFAGSDVDESEPAVDDERAA
jgi:replicative DNA helicase